MVTGDRALRAVLVLDVEPDLGAGIDPTERRLARLSCRGELLHVPRGRWPAAPDLARSQALAGLVIIDGLLTRELGMSELSVTEFLGAGDVLQPPTASELADVGAQIRLTALSDLVVLVLRRDFIAAAARWPALLTALQRRLEAQRERLAMQSVIAHFPNAEHRLLLMLWHLAHRWGHVTSDGVVLTWPLNHEILARLIGARRPTVTIALHKLEAAGALHRRPDGSWLVTATGEHLIHTFAGPPRAQASLGERLMLQHQVSQATTQAQALRAEARQIRAKGRAAVSERAEQRRED